HPVRPHGLGRSDGHRRLTAHLVGALAAHRRIHAAVKLICTAYLRTRGGFNTSITAARSAGNGALTENSTPVSGHTKLSWCACRNMRVSPTACIFSLNSASPYFSSPASG